VSGASLEGDWEVEATVPGGGTYTGRLVGRAVGNTVELEWEISAGRYLGIGLEAGGAWHVACGEDTAGLGLVLLDERGKVRWSPAPTRGLVAATRLAALGPGRWAAGIGTDPAFPFHAIVLTGEGDAREAALEGGPQPRGLALSWGRWHALAWYPSFDQLAVLRYTPEPGGWRAVWALGGRSGLASERLRPRA
jgi:hypothetical protein